MINNENYIKLLELYNVKIEEGDKLTVIVPTNSPLSLPLKMNEIVTVVKHNGDSLTLTNGNGYFIKRFDIMKLINEKRGK